MLRTHFDFMPVYFFDQRIFTSIIDVWHDAVYRAWKSVNGAASTDFGTRCSTFGCGTRDTAQLFDAGRTRYLGHRYFREDESAEV